MLKLLGLGGPLLAGGLYVSGVFGGGDYSRVVDRPPAAVMAALRDLDVRNQPGSPGTDASRSGGVAPLFRTAERADAMSWQVMSGTRIATTMWVELVALDGGKRTKVIAHVDRGDAPDDAVSPAFRSPKLTMGLFAMALEDELNDLTAPPRASADQCREMATSFVYNELGADPDLQSRTSVRDAMADHAKMAMRMSAIEAKMREAGCPSPNAGGQPFGAVAEQMAPAIEQTMRDSDPARPGGGVTFQPGQPMMNPNPDQRPVQ